MVTPSSTMQYVWVRLLGHHASPPLVCDPPASFVTGAPEACRYAVSFPEQCANGKTQDRTTHDVTGVVHSVVDPAVAHGGGRSVQREREQREICRHSRDEGERRGRMA